MRISLLQYDIAWKDKASNYNKVEALIVTAPKADLYVLPEMFNTGFCVEDVDEAEPVDGPSVLFLQRMAKLNACAIATSLMIKEDGKVFNAFVIVNEHGMQHRYDKIHLFGMSNENKFITAGNEIKDIELYGLRIRTVICYDIRFPYVCFNDSDYDVLLIVANWPAQRIKHWDALLRARAVENQAYVVAVNRVGVDPFNVQYPGHSSAYDYNGKRWLRFTGEGSEHIEVDLDALETFRAKLPFIKDRVS